MRLDAAFRLSFYLTLALACVCLGHAVGTYQPHLSYLVLPVAGLLLTAYLVEGRWLLPLWLFNLIATLITAVVGAATWSVVLDGYHGRMERSMASMFVLPYLGLFLLVLMLAMLFRPKRSFNYWFLHSMAFMSVALSCTLDNDFLFGLLLVPYLLCGVWSLGLFYLYRGQTVPSASPLPWRGLGTGPAGGRALLLLPLALAAFLLTPRTFALPADSTASPLTQFHTGLGEAMVDLNRTGSIKLNTEVAFEVQADDAHGHPKLDLNPNQYWRGAALNYYDHGRWFNRGLYLFRPPKRIPQEEIPTLKSLGSDEYFLKFTLSNRASSRRLLLADPVAVAPDDPYLPVLIYGHRSRQRPRAQHLDMEVMWPAVSGEEMRWVYVQSMVAPEEPGLSRPVRIAHLDETPLRQAPDVPDLREWTDALLLRLSAEGRLAATDLRRNPDGRLVVESHEKVARALETHLLSGEYRYTLQCPRRDPRADPLLDFLRDVKEGHCERFAGALALMLRSEGVPARIVVGFHGAESAGNGRYLVRHSQAHSWVEVLVQRPGTNGREWRWLMLDPTPAAEVEQAGDSSWLAWWKRFEHAGGTFWNDFIIDYSVPQREKAVAAMQDLVSLEHLPPLLAILALVAGTAFLGLTLAGRRAGCDAVVPAGAAFYRRWLQVVARRCQLRPRVGQTPQEFAEVVQRHLSASGRSTDVAAEVVRLYYRVRYAGQPLSAAEEEGIDRELTRLDRQLSEPAA